MDSECKPRPRLGVFKLASCDGCQLTVLDCEDELLPLAERVEIVHFTEASSRTAPEGPFDLVLIEGSVTTPEQLETVHRVRERARMMVAIGACATAGGIQALRNFADVDEFRRIVYASPQYIETLATSTPVSAHVKVDLELQGCPISKQQLLELITAILVGRKLAPSDESVCMECKRRGLVCVLVAHDEPCMGPVTRAGCGALCPAYARGCYGCFGPKEAPNARSLGERFRQAGLVPVEALRKFRGIYNQAPVFREESARHERDE